MILNRLAVPLALIASALIAGPQVARANTPVSFIGTVTDIDSAEPLGGVTVTMRSDKGVLIAKVVTDAKGAFALLAPDNGAVEVAVEKAGYGPCYSRFNMDIYGQLQADVRIAPSWDTDGCDGTIAVRDELDQQIMH